MHSAAGKLGGFGGAELPWLIGMCAYTMTPAHHEVLVVEDMAADARFNFMRVMVVFDGPTGLFRCCLLGLFCHMVTGFRERS